MDTRLLSWVIGIVLGGVVIGVGLVVAERLSR